MMSSSSDLPRLTPQVIGGTEVMSPRCWRDYSGQSIIHRVLKTESKSHFFLLIVQNPEGQAFKGHLTRESVHDSWADVCVSCIHCIKKVSQSHLPDPYTRVMWKSPLLASP